MIMAGREGGGAAGGAGLAVIIIMHRCAVLRGHRGELTAPVPVIAEASWLILDRLGTAAQAAFIRLVTSGQLTPVDLTEADWRRCAELAEQYASLRLDLVSRVRVLVRRCGGAGTATRRSPRRCSPRRCARGSRGTAMSGS